MLDLAEFIPVEGDGSGEFERIGGNHAFTSEIAGDPSGDHRAFAAIARPQLSASDLTSSGDFGKQHRTVHYT